MKAISIGSRYEIYDDIIVHDVSEDSSDGKDFVPDYMTITRAAGRDIHYLTA